MPNLLGIEAFDVAMAVYALRRNSKNLEFAKMSMEDVRKQALEAIGGEKAFISASTSPMGQLDRLNILEARVNDVITASRARAAKGT